MERTAITLGVDDQNTDLRFKVGAAVEYDRPLDFHISEGRGFVTLLIDSVRRIRSGEKPGLLVEFPQPNEFSLIDMTVPDSEACATVRLQPIAS